MSFDVVSTLSPPVWGCILLFLLTGGALHVHSSSLVSVEWLVKNVTYRPHCYICFTWDNSVRFLFSDRQPFPRWDCFYWQLLETLRAKIGDAAGFDNRLSKISPSLFYRFQVADPVGDFNPDRLFFGVFSVWYSTSHWSLWIQMGSTQAKMSCGRSLRKFSSRLPGSSHTLRCWRSISTRASPSSTWTTSCIWSSGAVSQGFVFACSFTPSTPASLKDIIQIPCFFFNVFQTYELDGTVHDKAWILKTFQEVTKKFKAGHPDFLGARIIISVHRYVPTNKITEMKCYMRCEQPSRQDKCKQSTFLQNHRYVQNS